MRKLDEASSSDVAKAEELTDKIFEVLFKSVRYALDNKIPDEVVYEVDQSTKAAGWPNPAYKNYKEAVWLIDWWPYYISNGGELSESEEYDFMDNYLDVISTVAAKAGDMIKDRYKIKDPSVGQLVKKILDTMSISIDTELDVEEDTYNAVIYLNLTSQLPGAGSSNEEKVELWHSNERRVDLKACGETELEDFYKIAKDKGYDEILDAIEDECRRRGIPSIGSKLDMPAGTVNEAKDITDNIFQALVRSVEQVLESDIRDRITDEYEASYTSDYADEVWFDSSYPNVKQQVWVLDWSDYYSDYGDIEETEAEITEKYYDKILPVIDAAKERILEKYRSKDPSTVSLVENILETVDISIGNDSAFDPEKGIYDGVVLLQLYLHAQFID